MEDVHPSQLVFVDESGVDSTNFRRKKGYARRGQRAFNITRAGRSKRTNIIAAASIDGILLVDTFQKPCDAQTFSDFIMNRLVCY